MKKFQHKRIAFIASACLTIALQAAAQTVENYTSPYGLKDEVGGYYEWIDNNDHSKGTKIKYDMNDNLGKMRRVHGIDDLVRGTLKGHHWKGNVVTPGEDMNDIYFVNVKTGQYLVLGDNWGSSPMLDHTGTKFNLKAGYTCKADQAGQSDEVLAPYQVDGTTPDGLTKASRIGQGFQIQLSSNPTRCLGRKQTAAGAPGSFEKIPLCLTRTSTDPEYNADPNSSGEHGHFVFHFYPVAKDGKCYYVIYTHRQTTTPIHDSFYRGKSLSVQYNWKRLVEFANRDSYLCLHAEDTNGGSRSTVPFKKFAGKMYYTDSETQYLYSKNYTATASTKTIGTDFKTECFSEDEMNFQSRNISEVSLADGLNTVANDSACLWKIVTARERKAYIVMADIDNPVDVSFHIENHNFYAESQVYEKLNATAADPKPFGWEWHDAETGTALHHHYYNANVTYNSEFHKIGTHFYDRWGFGSPNDNSIRNAKEATRRDERIMTNGLEADFVGSIYKGSATLRQTITGLRPGRYIAYCRAFYSPYGMTKFDNKNGFDASKNPTWESGSVPAGVTSAINDQTQNQNSYFFAISTPEEGQPAVRKRFLPSIYSGMTKLSNENLTGLTLQDFLETKEKEFIYTPLGDRLYGRDMGATYTTNENGQVVITPAWNNTNGGAGLSNKACYDLMVDSTVFAMVSYNGGKYFVPRNLTGAARFFSVTDSVKHKEAFNYRIGLPVEVGEDGELTLGIDHTTLDGNDDWVCFDNFELVYYGDAKCWNFVIDENIPENCTRYHDYFDWEIANHATQRRSLVAIKRSLDPAKFVPIVLPISLTRKQVRSAFGDGVKISEPTHITQKTIHFTAVNTTISSPDDENRIAMEAYKPYIVKPDVDAPVSKDATWTRKRFVGDNPFSWNASTQSYYKDDTVYVPKPGRNRQMGGTERWKKIPGPIYFVDGYTISKTAHYRTPVDGDHIIGGNGDHTKPYYNASNQWPAVGDVYVGEELMEIKGSTDGKTYQLRATCYYDAPGYENKRVPPYSYYMSNGNLLWNGATGSTQSKGFSFYLQIVESDPLETVQIVNQFGENVGPNLKNWTGWGNNLTSNANSGVAGVGLSAANASEAAYAAFNKENGAGHRQFVIRPNAANSTATVTITAPAGYKIDGYKIGGYCKDNTKETYTLTATGGESVNITENAANAEPQCLEKKRLNLDEMTVTLGNMTSNGTSYALFPVFVIYLRPVPVSGSAKVFTSRVSDFDWVHVDNGEVTGITETFREFENPASDLYYDLQGRPVKTPRKNGIYIWRGKKMVY